jgi:hypothetical protein
MNAEKTHDKPDELAGLSELFRGCKLDETEVVRACLAVCQTQDIPTSAIMAGDLNNIGQAFVVRALIQALLDLLMVLSGHSALEVAFAKKRSHCASGALDDDDDIPFGEPDTD